MYLLIEKTTTIYEHIFFSKKEAISI
jgi:hypothetical protein